MEQRLLTIRDAALYLGYGARGVEALRMAIYRKKLPSNLLVRIGGRIFFDKVALNAWIDSQRESK